ncbi:MAG: hypothetical protein KDK96_08495 [Chlamydiia bacterium]|nr:hypothetical protein [Chlamydiia bacterium]
MSSVSSTNTNSNPLPKQSSILTHVPEQRTNVEASFSHVVMPEANSLSNRYVEQLPSQSSSIPLSAPVFGDLHLSQEEKKVFSPAMPVLFEDDLELPSVMPTMFEAALPEVLPSAEDFRRLPTAQERRESAESKISPPSIEKEKKDQIDYQAKCAELEKQEEHYTAREWSQDIVVKAQASLEPNSLGSWIMVANLSNNLRLRIKALGCNLRDQMIGWDGWQLQILDELEVRENIKRQGGGQCQPRNLMNFLQSKHETLVKYGTFNNGCFSLERGDPDTDWKAKYKALKKQEMERKAIEWSKDVVIKAQASLEPDSLGKWVTVANLTNDLKLRIKALGCSQNGQRIAWDGWHIQIIGLLEVKENIRRQGGGQCQPMNLMNFLKDNYENLLKNGTFNRI